MTRQHKILAEGNNHQIHNWTVVSTIARDALIVTEDDVGKVCLVTGVGLFWLETASPVTWQSFGAGIATEHFYTEPVIVQVKRLDEVIAGGEAVYINDDEPVYAGEALFPDFVTTSDGDIISAGI